MNNHDSAWDRYEKARTSRHLTAMTLAEAMDKGYDNVEVHLTHYRVATRIFNEAMEALDKYSEPLPCSCNDKTEEVQTAEVAT